MVMHLVSVNLQMGNQQVADEDGMVDVLAPMIGMEEPVDQDILILR